MLLSLGALFGVMVLLVMAVGTWIGNLERETQASRIPIPEDVPPAAALPAPIVDLALPDPAQQLADWAVVGEQDMAIPARALMAYGLGENYARVHFPSCGLAWNTLAGIGFVETVHGTYNGTRFGGSFIEADGFTSSPIRGPQLDGNGFAAIRDSDGGTLDGDTEWDRAVGAMQFIPEAWRLYGVDMNNDGSVLPSHIDDAVGAAVRLLCDKDRVLTTPEGWTAAIRGYNFSNEYVRNVRDAAANYALGQRAGA